MAKVRRSGKVFMGVMVTPELHQAVQLRATHDRVSMAAIVRAALRDYFATKAAQRYEAETRR